MVEFWYYEIVIIFCLLRLGLFWCCVVWLWLFLVWDLYVYVWIGVEIVIVDVNVVIVMYFDNLFIDLFY